MKYAALNSARSVRRSLPAATAARLDTAQGGKRDPDSLKLNSCLYEGAVSHCRRGDVSHRFRQSLFLLYLDLDEIDRVFDGRWLWSARRPAVARYCRTDFAGPANRPLADCIRDVVQHKLGNRPNGPIRLLTGVRYFGYLMNPVSFYFCFDSSESLVAVVAEVTNTPWSERHLYVLSTNDVTSTQYTQHAKEFHVSPFFGMDLTYRFRIGVPGQHLSIGIQSRQNGRLVFSAAMTLSRREITSFSLSRALIRYPFMTGRIVAGIYWQAFRLWWKGATFYPHPTRTPVSEDSSTATCTTHVSR